MTAAEALEMLQNLDSDDSDAEDLLSNIAKLRAFFSEGC